MGIPADLDDRELAERARAGDDAAFGLLYERHAQRLHDFLLRVVRDPAVAEDLVQATFLRVYERRATLRDPARVRSWIFTTAHNLAMNHLEQRRPTEPVEEAWDLPAAGRGPEGAAAVAETAGLVWDAAASLEPRQYAVLDMAVRQELSTPEIAEVLGVPSAHAAVLVNRAREALGNAVRYLLVARRRDRCERLAALVPEGVRALTREQRSAVDYHMRRCDTCQATARLATAPEELFAAIPLLPLPASLRLPPWHLGVPPAGLPRSPGASGVARTGLRAWWVAVAAAAVAAGVAGALIATHHGGGAPSGGGPPPSPAARPLDLAAVAAHGFAPVALPAGTLPSSAFLVDATCASATDCYVVGGTASSGLVLATHDAARTWTATPLDDAQSLGAVACSGPLSCWAGGSAAGGDALILHTTDGRTWREQMRRSGAVVGSLACPSSTGCIAVGTDLRSNLTDVLASTDGGATWSSRPLPGSGPRVLAVRCWDAGHCLAVGSDAWATDDLGTSWRPTASVQSTPAPGARIGSLAVELEDASFVSARDVWVIGGNQCGGQGVTQCPSFLFHSTDGGASWSPAVPDQARQPFPFGWQASCTTGGCLVIGQAFRTSTILAGEESRWRTLLTTPGQLEALTCSSGGFCIAAGGGAPGPTLLLARA